jgi:sugar phosphate permease
LSFGIAGAPGGANKKQNAQSQEHSALVRAYQDIKIGVLYVIEAPRIHALLWVAFLVNFSGLCITGGLLPIVARDVYGMDELGLGTLIATFATGALAGSLLIATVMRATRPDRLIIYSLIAWHVTLIGFAFTTSPAIGVPLLGVVGLLSSLVMVPLASTLVAIAGVEFRGRVMGLRQLAVVGLPLGLLLAGLLIEVINITTALVTLSAVGVILGIALAAMWQRITGTSLR